MKKGLFINNSRAQDSIYESGVMVFNSLRLSKQYQLDYVEIDIDHRSLPQGYDFYFFNYHPSTMSWMDTAQLKKLKGLLLTMVLEVLPDDPFVFVHERHFHGYCVLDPTVRLKNPRVFPFPRPLEKAESLPPYVEKEVPVIGTFGFATRGKGFQHVVDAVNKEFEKAIIRINIPFGDFVPDSESYSQFLSKLCRDRAKEGIEVMVTHDYMSKGELIRWCSQNTLNCFLYDRKMPGLAATTDQAIVTGRPLAVSANETFRHILAYLPPYPQWSLKRSIEESAELVKRMEEDWSPEKFAQKFEEVLFKLSKTSDIRSLTIEEFEIPLFRNTYLQQVLRRYRKYKRLLTLRKLRRVFFSGLHQKNEELI
jgi:hypothetical protein